ncbi:hypothetical protein WR25_11270 [Diploscapter pachys]|uniref:Metalloendopeptidase n=1 Tax=Diploscapter pachys TaxID=2018661 RepID=A0A2A2KB74_9BILA|nr:hypothetical protein WR25_11270 [Diploscapter pachys]
MKSALFPKKSEKNKVLRKPLKDVSNMAKSAEFRRPKIGKPGKRIDKLKDLFGIDLGKYHERINLVQKANTNEDGDLILPWQIEDRPTLFEDSENAVKNSTTLSQFNRCGREVIKRDDEVVFLSHTLFNVHNRSPLERPDYSQTRPKDSKLKKLRKFMNFNQNDDSKSEIPTSSANLINKNSTIKEYLYQGDILLNDAQLDIMLSDQGLIHDQSRRRKRQGSNSGIARWTNGVFYSYAGSADDIMKQAFQMAVKFWSDHTCINFYENDSIRDRIEVFKGSGCYSYVGKLGGVQELSLGNGCADRAIASHELGHALGFFHTHSRWDRDDYITVNAKNLDPNYADQYLKESKEINDNFGLPYDYGSIMHYDCTSSSVDGKKITMTAKNDEYQAAMGSPVVSFYDVLMMNIMYNCLDKCDSYSSAKCLNGGYPSPRNCSKCVCPGAYSGPNCERLPNICGRNLTAEPDWQRFNVSLRSNMLKDLKPTDYLLPLMECDYWITSPENTTIEIIVRALDIVADTYGCTFGAVEIKIGPDQNYTGIRICMKQYGVNVVYRSTYNFMGIRVYNTIVKTKASISYRYVSSNSTDPGNDVPIFPEIIQYWGYPVEVHHVTTRDGYILGLIRIPYGKFGNGTHQKDVVFLQHGLLAGCSNWITNLPHLALGYILADAGFDVWLGNMRGSEWSIGHETLDTNEHPYWEFSWDEMAQSDLDAMIDYALAQGKQQSLYYVGTLTMFSKLSVDSNIAPKIRQFFALAPVGTVANITGILRYFADNYMWDVDLFFEIMGKNQFLPENGAVHKYQQTYCKDTLVDYACENFLFLLCGPESHQMNISRLEVFLSDMPGGTSTQNMLHWVQQVHSGLHQMYDYGSAKKNEQHYGQKTPPLYDITRIRTDMYLWWSPSDTLADQSDVERYLLKKLPTQYLKGVYKLMDFNHLDFIWGNRAATEIYMPLIDIIRNDQMNRLRKELEELRAKQK